MLAHLRERKKKDKTEGSESKKKEGGAADG
jgi:hypothetical protein